MKASICVLIPAYNEEDCIATTLTEVLPIKNTDVIVVDDGSTDTTALIVKKMGVKVLSLRQNLGAGVAFQRGMEYALRHGFTYAVQLDADGQHNPQDIPRMVEAVKKNKADLIIGSRYLDENEYQTPWQRLIGIRLLSMLIWLKTGKRVVDPTSGYRLYTKRAMKFIHDTIHRRSLEAPLVTRLLQSDYMVCEIPVVMRKRSAGFSKLTLFKGTAYLVKSIGGVLSS